MKGSLEEFGFGGKEDQGAGRDGVSGQRRKERGKKGEGERETGRNTPMLEKSTVY